MNPLTFAIKWKNGIRDLSQAQQLHSKLIGNWGQLIGMILAFVVLIYKGYWYFSVFMLFALFLQIITLIGANQEYKNYCKMIDELKEMKL